MPGDRSANILIEPIFETQATFVAQLHNEGSCEGFADRSDTKLGVCVGNGLARTAHEQHRSFVCHSGSRSRQAFTLLERHQATLQIGS
jgi:hypothetical protein